MSGVTGRIAGVLVLVALLAAALLLYGWLRNRPQDLPWTRLDLGQPVGLFTARKLAALTGDFAQCRALLDRAGVAYTALPPVQGEACGYADGVRLDASEGARRIALSPAGEGMACPVAAALAMWEWNAVQPAAQAHFGSRVTRIDHLGSYSCRRLYGRDTGDWSEHATADALDVAGFRLADGRRISVLRDWSGSGAEAAFLREVRDGACRLFATVLSPEYNDAHRDHFHFDQAERGANGRRACR